MLHSLLRYAPILSGSSTLQVLALARWVAGACQKIDFAARVEPDTMQLQVVPTIDVSLCFVQGPHPHKR